MGGGARSSSPARRGPLRGQLQLPEQDVPAAHAPGGADDDRRGARPRRPGHRRRLGRERSSRRCISIAAPALVVVGRGRGHAGRAARRARAGGPTRRSSDVPGLVLRDATRRDRAAPPAREIIRDLDALPRPAWDLVDVERYRRVWRQRHGYFSMNVVDDARLPVPLQLVREADLRPALHRAIGRRASSTRSPG